MKWLGWLVFFLIILSAFAWLGLYFDSLRHGPQAAYLLADLQQLSFDRTDLSTAHRFSDTHDGAVVDSKNCNAARCDFVVHVTPLTTRLARDHHSFAPVLSAFGLRPWSVTASLNIRNDKLTHLSIAANQARLEKPLEFFADITRDPAEPNTTQAPSKPEGHAPHAKPAAHGKEASSKLPAPPSFTVVHPQPGEPPSDITQVWILTDPTHAWHRAFDLDLTCFLAVFNSCRDAQQLAPSLPIQ